MEDSNFKTIETHPLLNENQSNQLNFSGVIVFQQDSLLKTANCHTGNPKYLRKRLNFLFYIQRI